MEAADVFQATRRLLPETLLQASAAAPADPRLLAVLATVEIRLVELLERLDAVEARLVDLRSSSLELGRVELLREKSEFLVYLSTPDGYDLIPATGPLPHPGDLFGEGGEATVLTVGRSPLPDDARPCVFALHT